MSASLISRRTLILVLLAFALCQGSLVKTRGQDRLIHFSSNGLSLDFPATTEFDDRSTASGQHLVFQRKDHAQIMVVSRYAQVRTDAELAAAKHDVVDSFIEKMWQRIHEQDPNVLRTEAQIEVAGKMATGVRLRAVMDNQPGNVEIYSLKLGSRLVLLSLIGSDREIAASAPAWLAIRRSLKIE